MTPIEKAFTQLGGQAATSRMFGVSPQAANKWSAQGRVPAEYCPRIEHLLAGAVRCEELNDRVEWDLIRGTDRVRKISETVTIDHAAEMRGAIAQTRLVFEGHRDAQDALEYLEQVLKAGQRAEVPAHACEPEESAAAAMAAESAQLVIQAEKAAAGAAARATVDPVAVLSRELFSLADKLHQPADLVVQLLVLAELRGMRAEQASDRFARGAAVLS